MLSTEEIIARYYVGYYNRAPDPEGFDFWVTNFNDGVTSLEVANFFSNQDETDALYPYFQDPANNSPEQFIRSVYDNLFNRDPDDEGLAFWMAQLTTGGVSTGQMIEAIIEGAVTNPDLAVVQNKVASALYWEDQAKTFPDFDYDAAATASANDALAVVTDDPDTVTTSQTQSNAFFAQLTEDKGDPGSDLTDDGSEDDKVGIATDGLSGDFDVTLSSAVSDPVINLEAFRNDGRFAGIDGSGQTVVVIDTGIDLNHPAFGPDRDNNGIADRIVFSRDFTNEGDGTADDEQGHGSNVASIVASSNGNYTGVAPGANIVALQALDRTGSGSSSGIEEALQWVVQNAEAMNIVAVNMSLGAGQNTNSISTHPVYGDELQVLNDTLGVTTVVAAGNSYADFQREGASELSADPNTIAIGAVGGSASSGGDITFFSQRSDDIPTIFAPGSFIEGAAPGGGSSESSGTSQATPHVAGMVALAQQLAQQELGRPLTPDEFARLLEQSGDRFVDDENFSDRVINTGDTYVRADMFDLAEAILNLAGGGGGTPTPDPGPTPAPRPGDDVRGDIDSDATIVVGSSRTGTIDFAGDEDFFAVNLTPGEYEISLEGAATGAGSLSDPLMSLLTSGGAFITSNDDGGAGLNSLIEFVVSDGGTYFINANAFSNATGTYTLDIQRTGGTDGDVGETPGSAGSLNIGSSVTSALEFGADRDWFAVQLTGGQSYTFDMVGGTLSDPYLFLHDSSGRVIASNDDGGPGLDSSLEFIADSSGTYYLSAEAFSTSQTGTYTLSATGQGASGDDFADNTGTTGFVEAVSGTSTGNLEVAGDRDWFRVDLQAGASYDLAVNGDGLSDPYMYLYDSSGALVGTDDDGGPGLNSMLSVTADASESYYIGVGSYSDAYEGDYTVSSTLTSQTGGDVPGDASTTASLEVGQSLIGVIDAPGDTDWYGINVIQGRTYELVMEAGGPDPISDAYLAILDLQGNVQLQNDDFNGRDSLIAFEVFQSGRFFVSAETFSSTNDSGTYELSLYETGSFSSVSSVGISAQATDFDGFV